jgi:hypothetical protein
MNPTLWHTKSKSVLKFQSPEICSWWRKLRNFFYMLYLQTRINRIFTSDLYKKYFYHVACLKKKCSENFNYLRWVLAVESVMKICYKLYGQTHGCIGSWHRIRTKMNPTIWHAKRKSVLKFQASERSSCWGNCDENLFNTLLTNAQINRKLTSDSYKNGSHHMVC